MHQLSACIFDLKMDITADEPHYLDHFAGFFQQKNGPADFKLNIVTQDRIVPPEDVSIKLGGVEWIPHHSSRDGSFYAFKKGDDSEDWCCMFEVNPCWDEAGLLISREFKAPFTLIPLMDLIFRNLIVLHGGIILHASAVEFKGKNIMFSAPSETGKTTQAALWQKHRGASLMNDDHTALRVVDEQAFAYGVPWAKYGGKAQNCSCPLLAIVFLEQAQENRVHKIDQAEVSRRLIPRCFMPFFSKTLMNRALDNLEKLIGHVPFYLLQCRPDEDAVDVLDKVIYT